MQHQAWFGDIHPVLISGLIFFHEECLVGIQLHFFQSVCAVHLSLQIGFLNNVVRISDILGI